MKKCMAFAATILLSLSVVAQAETIKNWAAPSTWTPPAAKAEGGRTALANYPPLPFTPVTPCRIADTRVGSGFPAGYGPPSLASGVARVFTIAGQCGIPAGASAVSFNFAVWNTLSYGDLKVYPTGGTVAAVSTINWSPGVLALANAAVVPLGAGQITTINEGTAPVDLFFDVNGYYAATQAPGGGTFNLFTDNVYAIWGESTNAAGGYGTIGRAVNGTAGIGAFGRGSQYGVWGTTQGSTAIGVYGDSSGSNGVQGVTTAITFPPSAGVYGVDAATALPLGLSNQRAGVYGVSKSNIGVEGLSENAGVRGECYTSAGVFRSLGLLGFGTYGVYSNGDMFASGTISGTIKAFVQPHPTDATKEIDYISLEGPASEIYFRGSTNVTRGLTTIPIPDHFRLVSRAGSYSALVSPVGAMANVAVIEQGEDGIVVQASRDVKINYVVYAERETFKGHVPVTENIHFLPDSENGLLAVAPAYKQILIENGTLNPDGTTNLQTADRLGWRRAWEEKRARGAADVAAAQAKAAASRSVPQPLAPPSGSMP